MKFKKLRISIQKRIMNIFHAYSLSMCDQKQEHLAMSLRLCHDGRVGVSNHQSNYCLLKRLFRRISKKTLKLRVTGLCAGNSPAAGEFPAQRASNAEIGFIWWRHHDTVELCQLNAQQSSPVVH